MKQKITSLIGLRKNCKKVKNPIFRKNYKKVFSRTNSSTKPKKAIIHSRWLVGLFPSKDPVKLMIDSTLIMDEHLYMPK